MFEKASRKSYRFDSPMGKLTVEDLWELPLVGRSTNRSSANLDDIARDLHKKLKNGEDVSFVITERKSDGLVQDMFDIVKHIIDVRLNEDKARAERQSRKDTKNKLLEIMSRKQDQALENKTIEELKAELDALDA